MSIPLDPDCIFLIASLTKQFTAIAIKTLAERGRLSIDAPIETYLPDWPTRDRGVTVRHLLNHTSGVWSHDSQHVDRTLRPNPPVEAVIQLIYKEPFEFEPGERYSYNNSGYLLLGAIIGAASGKTYEDYLRDEIFAPLGMTRTGILRHEAVTPLRAYGYVRGRKRFHNARLDAMNWSDAAGALGSTLDDLAKWDRAIRTNQLISAETFEAMLTSTTMTDGSSFPYGLGWGTAEYEGRRIYHHTGGISGYASHMLHLRDEDLTTIVLSNLYLFPFDKVTRGLLRATFGLEETRRTPVTLDTNQLVAFTGRFQGDGYVRELFASDRGLAFTQPSTPSLLPLSAYAFWQVDDPEVEYRFSDLREGRYHSLKHASPLWPDNVLTRMSDA